MTAPGLEPLLNLFLVARSPQNVLKYAWVLLKVLWLGNLIVAFSDLVMVLSIMGVFSSSFASSTWARIEVLAEDFAGVLPEDEFSYAQVQGYLLKYKKD